MTIIELRIPHPETFGQRLKYLRAVELDISLEEFAERIGEKPSTLATWEKGVRPQRLAEIAKRIEEEFQIDRNWLLYGDEAREMSTPPGTRTRNLRNKRSLPLAA